MLDLLTQKLHVDQNPLPGDAQGPLRTGPSFPHRLEPHPLGTSLHSVGADPSPSPAHQVHDPLDFPPPFVFLIARGQRQGPADAFRHATQVRAHAGRGHAGPRYKRPQPQHPRGRRTDARAHFGRHPPGAPAADGLQGMVARKRGLAGVRGPRRPAGVWRSRCLRRPRGLRRTNILGRERREVGG